MSEDSESDFDEFLEIARGDHATSAMPPANAKRIEASVRPHVSWQRRLPAGIVAGLAAMSSPAPAGAQGKKEMASNGRSLTPGSWAKLLAALVPVLGLAAFSYSVTTPPAPPTKVGPGAPIASAILIPPSSAGPIAPPAMIATMASPGELPNATAPAAAAGRPAKPSAPIANRGDDETFEAELALLSQVTSSLQAKQPARALALIDEHDRRFPGGVLTPEFTGERVLTLVALGRSAEACAQSTAFLAKYPKSPLVPQVRSSCVHSLSTP